MYDRRRVGAPNEEDGRHRQTQLGCGPNPRGGEVAINRILAAVVGGIAVVAAGVAVADSYASTKQADFFAPGKHQFYVWCAGGKDYTATQKGMSAEDAALYQKPFDHVTEFVKPLREKGKRECRRLRWRRRAGPAPR